MENAHTDLILVPNDRWGRPLSVLVPYLDLSRQDELRLDGAWKMQ